MTSLNTHSDPLILEMRSITKEFPGVKALADVSLRVKAGSATPSTPNSASRGLRRWTARHSGAAPFWVMPA